MNLTIADVLSIARVGLRNGEGLRPNTKIRVSTDSRTTRRGDVFIALRGEKFDGHMFVPGGFEAGAVLAVVDEGSDVASFGTRALVIVKDTTKALGQLAHLYRMKFSIPFVAVAGSNGKTMTKDMIAAVLARKFSVLKTEGNLNNHIGVPQTMLRLQKHHDVAVIEIGTNHFGELAYLCEVLQPTHGLVTNIGREHLEFFGDRKGVAKEEGTLFDAIAKSGVGFINADDLFVLRRSRKVRRKVLYGFSKRDVSVRGTYVGLDEKARAAFSVKVKGKKKFHVRLATPGKHLLSNALAAAAVGFTFKLRTSAVRTALGRFVSTGKRMEVQSIGGVTILNDTYNANPDSTLGALETLKAMHSRGKKIAVLADMLELGSRSEREHRKIGFAVSHVADYLLTFGPNARFVHEGATIKMKLHYDQKNVLSEYLAELASPGDVILVKGSRGMRMEDVVTFLVNRLKSTKKVVSLAV